MQIFTSKKTLSLALKDHANIGFVPTMGNLHAGHLHLVKLAKQYADCVVVSIFVNPLQFSANEDLANYPRTFEADCEKLEAAGCDIIFAPTIAEIYPQMTKSASGDIHLHQTMLIQLPAIANVLCGVWIATR